MISAQVQVPFSRPFVGEEEIEAIAGVLRSGWLTTGSQAAGFEEEFRNYVGAGAALAVTSCTAGLNLALSALNIGPGDEVITTPLTYCGTIQAIEETGARAVLCDIGEDLNIDASALHRCLTSRTRAILPVHIAGLACCMEEIWRFAEHHGLKVIEDAAHASGAEYGGSPIGCGRSDAVVFSFFANKNMTTGEGGMIVSHSLELVARMRRMSRHGVQRPASAGEQSPSWYYEVVDRGMKCNLSDIAAAMGRVQLQKLPAMLRRRTEIAGQYCEALSQYELELPPQRADCGHAWHLFIVRLNLAALAIDRNRFTQEMALRGVECSVHFIPIPLHPYYRDRYTDPAGYAEAFRQYPRLVSLPLYPGMTDDDVEHVVRSVGDVIATYRALRPVCDCRRDRI